MNITFWFHPKQGWPFDTQASFVPCIGATYERYNNTYVVEDVLYEEDSDGGVSVTVKLCEE